MLKNGLALRSQRRLFGESRRCGAHDPGMPRAPRDGGEPPEGSALGKGAKPLSLDSSPAEAVKCIAARGQRERYPVLDAPDLLRCERRSNPARNERQSPDPLPLMTPPNPPLS